MPRTSAGLAHCDERSAKWTTYGTWRDTTVSTPWGLHRGALQMSGTPPGGVTSQHSLPKRMTHEPPGHWLATVQFALALVPPTQRCGEIGGLPPGQPPTDGRSMHILPPS